MKIALISCSSKKSNKIEKAKNLYTSQLFKSALRYAEKNSNKIFILSAKHHLLNLEQEIEPYNLTLNNMKDNEIKLWADKVLEQLSQLTNLKEDEFIFLAGERYRRYLIPQIKNYSIPMQGLGIGKQLKWLKENS